MTDHSAAAPRFSIGTALSESLRYAIPGIGHVLKISWLLILAFVVATTVSVVILGSIFGIEEVTQQEEYSAGRILFNLVTIVIGLLFGSAFLIVIARDHVLQESPPRLFPAFWPVVLRYFLLALIFLGAVLVLTIVFTVAGIALGVAAGDSALAAGLIGVTGAVLSFIALAYLICRLITWVVSRAVDQPQTLRQAWRATAGATGWKIFAGLVILVLLSIAAVLAAALVWSFVFFTLSELPGFVIIPVLILIVVAAIVAYLMFLALITVYPANVFKQIAGA